MAASLSSALCTLADRSAATSSDCWLGVVWTWKPASEAVSSSTISVRSPRDRRARRGGNGGGKRRQMATMTASARTPAPRKRGRVSSKPTVEGQPFSRDHSKRRQRDPRPDLQLAAVGGLDGDRPRWGQRQPIRRLQLRDRIGEKIDAEPGALHLAGNHLLDGVEAGRIGFGEGGDRAGRQRAAAAG